MPAGRSVERGGVRFSCAAGGAACAVTVDPGSGQARVTGGRLAVARVQAMPNDDGRGGGQNGGGEEADWPFPDWPTTYVNSGGGALSWSPGEIHNRIRAIEDGGYTGYGDSSGSSVAAWCTTGYSDESHCDVEYRAVMTYPHGGIPIVQARALNTSDSGTDGRPGEEIGIGGILDHGYFMVARQREYIGRDYEDEEIGAETYVYSRDDYLDEVSTGRWRGALVGTGNSETSPLYRQFVIGDVDITVELGTVEIGDIFWRNIDIAFSNVRNVNTGTPVMLSHTQWHYDNSCCKSVGGASLSTPSSSTPGYMAMTFRGPNDEEAFGAFYTEEAVGAFGAKKQ